MKTDSVIAILKKFAKSFDSKNWIGMEECLADVVFIDYSSFRKTKPSTISKFDYIELRKTGLENLNTFHDYFNYKMLYVNDNRSECNCDFVIKRFNKDNSDFFHSYGEYKFELEKIDDEWRIVKIIQIVAKNEGKANIHGAFKNQTATIE